MTSQEIIERDLRMTIGDLQVQLIIARAQIIELRQQASITAEENMIQAGEISAKGNGINKPIMTPIQDKNIA